MLAPNMCKCLPLCASVLCQHLQILFINGSFCVTASSFSLDAVDPNAYDAFKASRNLGDVIERVLRNQQEASNGSGPRKLLTVEALLMTPVQPMLAEACKSIEHAMKKCPNGMYSEIKYDGERVQVHKNGNTFSYFSRSLKPVLPHKVGLIKPVYAASV
ncbi:DNA ligase 3 [Xenoophorus captivus]|uniref:DNA ligase 3 n=1 Tax=Xenoophorus captivus TaxID=1517983 RepID=A0ABV0RP00_9TELE